jgi:hypothetical protein
MPSHRRSVAINASLMRPICESSAVEPVCWASVTTWPWALAGSASTSFTRATSASGPSAAGVPLGQPRAKPVSAATAVGCGASGSRTSTAATAAASAPRATCSATRSTRASRAGDGFSAAGVVASREGSTPADWTAAALVAASASTGSASVRGSASIVVTIAAASGDDGHSPSASSTASRTSGAGSSITVEPVSFTSVPESRGRAFRAFMRTPADGCASADCTRATASGSAVDPSSAPS